MERKSRLGQCPRCLSRDDDKTEKKLFRCSVCGVWYCEKHVSPKPCYIVDLGKADKDTTKWQYLNDDESGHPDAQYIEKQALDFVSRPITPTEKTKLPEPPVTVPSEIKEKKDRQFGTCPKCKCTDSDIIKSYPKKAILNCWNCHLKYGQRNYPPYHYIRLRKRKPNLKPQSSEQSNSRPKAPILLSRTYNEKKNNSAKKTIIAGAIVVSFLVIILFSGALSNFSSQVLPSLPSSSLSTSQTLPPPAPAIDITGRVVTAAGEIVSGVDLHVIDSRGNEVITGKTNATGVFSFDSLPSSTYNVSITLPYGYIARSDTSYSISISHNLEFKIQNMLTNPKTVQYHYTLRGVSSEMVFTVYGGMYDYLLSVENSTVSYIGQEPSSETMSRVLNLRYIDENVETGELHSLVRAIQQITSNEDDQARIAISLVQNIPYGGNSDNHDWKYPYEVLYSNMGVCSEKSRLLVCLLRELGYGCSILEFPSQNHAAVGIACPSQYAYYSGYAFVESTTPTIITDWHGDYIGVGKLPSSPDYVIVVQEGKLMNSVSEEYQDDKTYQSLINMGPVLDELYYNQWQSLVSKYGIHVS